MRMRSWKIMKNSLLCKKISGFCYTQLYDIEQEQNGFYRYDRSDKLTAKQKDRIREINEKYPRN